ncbi:sensor domain-containing diguanylate cyclase [Paraburkholderia sp. BCC1886]|uniref:sensor domain-containing diguanylate cyclase n=1 Tax=Paraburkholderia sp. BCC1886 TaxID=2562670 RepID=UPI0011845AAC|nr:sensor domain-containing diguanylate cyclase [Paraburkholderia sp. BCC1886]
MNPIDDEDNADAEKTLQSEHEALLSFVYMSPVGIIRSDIAGRIDMMNPLAAQLLMPLVGEKGIENIFESLASVAPELRSFVQSFTAARGPVCENHRVFVTPAHERAIVLSCSIIKISNQLLMTVLTDISRQVAAERRARQTESWLAAIYTNVKDFAFFSLDAQGCAMSWNASVERVTGFSESETLGQTLAHFYSPGQFLPHRSPEHLAFARGQGWHVEECWCKTRDGTRYWGQILVAVSREDDGAFTGYTVVLRDITERKMTADNLKRLLTTDHLTGASSRAHFFDVAEAEIARVRRDGGTLSLVMLDADHFKQINDTAGHLAGDEVLKRIVVEAKQLLREQDVFARVGGEEFVLMLSGADAAHAAQIAERLRAAIEAARVVTDAGELRVTVSLGCVTLSESCATLRGLLDASDRALYEAKSAGRNCVR